MADEVIDKKAGPRQGLWQYCTKFAKQANAAKKRAQHLRNLAERQAKGR